MKLESLYPHPAERVALVGMTGSGKSTLGEYIVSPFQHCFALDPKGLLQRDGKWSGFKRYTTLSKFKASEAERRIFAPIHEELIDPDAIDSFFEYLYERGNTFCYVDEVYAIAKGDYMIPRHYHAILTRGRERGIGCVSATQRPKGIPQVVLSESGRHFIFKLLLQGDRDKVAEITGIEEERISALKKQQFLIFDEAIDFPLKPFKLQLP